MTRIIRFWKGLSRRERRALVVASAGLIFRAIVAVALVAAGWSLLTSLATIAANTTCAA